jgi:hypothetical protein
VATVHLVNVTGGTITNSSRINPDKIKITGKNSVKISNQNMTGAAAGDSSGRAGGDSPYHELLCCRFNAPGGGNRSPGQRHRRHDHQQQPNQSGFDQDHRQYIFTGTREMSCVPI